MPNESVNLYLSIQSGNSEPTLVSLSDKTRALDKASQELQQTLEAMQQANQPLIVRQAELKASLEEQKNTVSELRAEYKKYGDDMSGLKMQLAIEEQDALKRELMDVENQLKTNQKIFREYREDIRKGALSDSGLASPGSGVDGSNAINVLAALGIGDKLSSLAQEAGGAFLSSALGGDMGGLVSGVLSSTLAGAAAGSIIPVIGPAVGAGIGALSGLISGGTKIFEAKDDAFKDYYGGLYEDVKGSSGEMVEAGSTIAGGREQTRMAFSRRLGGDGEAATYLAQVEKMAANTNYDYDEIVGYAKLLLNSYDPNEVFGVLRDLSDATAGLDLSSSDVNMMISGLSRMRTTGKATQEYLNYFRERGVDVDQALADALSVDKSSIAGMVTKGKIGGEDAAQAILEFIQKEFGGLSDNLASTYDAMVDNLGDITSSLQAKGGDAYNELRKESVQAEMDALDGELGDAIGEINRIMGENQARRENLQDQYMREVQAMVTLGEKGELWDKLDVTQQNNLTEMSQRYADLMARYEESDRTDWEAGAELEWLYKQTEVLGQAYFDNSDEVARLNDIELDAIDAIRENTAGLTEATQASYNLAQELSKGRGAVLISATGTSTGAGSHLTTSNGGHVTRAEEQQDYYVTYSGLKVPYSNSHAFGLTRVPYDDYPALLHRDERVLTASEARAQDAGQGQPIKLTITGNNFAGMPEEMADQLFEIIVRKLERAYTAAEPK